jgi:hypothetical protein
MLKGEVGEARNSYSLAEEALKSAEERKVTVINEA